MDVKAYNRHAWDQEVQRGNPWTVPVGPDVIAAARAGRWEIVLTPIKPIPRGWFPADMTGVDILCLASGGGQQAPVLAATGARVTVLDNSEGQLGQDRLVAEREGLDIRTIHGEMADLSMLEDASFDLIVHPVSNCFAPEIRPVWRESFRVLRPGGALLAGYFNPAAFVFDDPYTKEGPLKVSFTLPYSDIASLSEERRQAFIDKDEPLLFGHMLDDQIGGQLDAGFLIAGFYEDHTPGVLLAEHMPMFIATRAIKPAA